MQGFWGVGYTAWGPGFRVQGLGRRAQSVECRGRGEGKGFRMYYTYSSLKDVVDLLLTSAHMRERFLCVKDLNLVYRCGAAKALAPEPYTLNP